MHDKHGNPLKAGDKVVLTGTVENIWPDNDYCNCTVKFDETEGAKAAPGSITFNSQHCELLGSAPVEGAAVDNGEGQE